MIIMQPYYMGPPLINLPVGYPTYQANLTTEQGKNNFDSRHIYNQEVGWRERTANEMPGLDDSVGNLLDPVLGPPLQFIGETTILFAKAALYTGLALATLTVLSPLVGNLIESVR